TAARVYGENFGLNAAKCLALGEHSNAADLGEIGEINLLLASPECTNHTCARGSKPRDDGSRRTANYVLQFAADLNPRWIVIENVVHMRSWQGYEPIVSGLSGLGYNVSAQILNAADFGVPQNRRRLFLLADALAIPPEIMGTSRTLRTARSILDPIGTWRSRPLYRPGRAVATIERAERAMAALGKGHAFLIVYYGSDGSGGWQGLDQPLRTMTTLDRFGLVTWDAGEPMLRMLQVSELRRAMGFTKPFKLGGRRRDNVRLLGNGVAPPVMRAVVSQLCREQEVAIAAE
ncbi:DNA cytosine methyltransferase, partial [Allosphingosinicella sp.]|uniref:DNA cytosine methyltransferase n=1 Tax=Allosphingosinicella sp. TaxID=2823234 RepID=UPI0037840051